MVDKNQILHTAALDAGEIMGISETDCKEIVKFDDNRAAMLVRCYENLFHLLGNDLPNIKWWVQGENKGTGGIPLEQMKTEEGLLVVLNYLDTSLHR